MIDRVALHHLMSAAADGERACVEPLFAALWPLAVNYARRFLADDALAEDAAQEALVKLFRQLSSFDRERDALTWALTHVTWQCRTVRRARQRRSENAVEIDDVGALLGDDRPALEDRELVRAALEALATLAPRDREVIAASLTDDDELRRAVAPATYRKRLERAFARLRLSWRSRHGTL